MQTKWSYLTGSSGEEGFGKPNPPKPGPVCAMIVRVVTVNLFCNCRDLDPRALSKTVGN